MYDGLLPWSNRTNFGFGEILRVLGSEFWTLCYETKGAVRVLIGRIP